MSASYYVLLTVLFYPLLCIPLLYLCLRRSLFGAADTEQRGTLMDEIRIPVRVNVARFNVDARRHTAYGALHNAHLDPSATTECVVFAAYAEATIAPANPETHDPRHYQICLN